MFRDLGSGQVVASSAGIVRGHPQFGDARIECRLNAIFHPFLQRIGRAAIHQGLRRQLDPCDGPHTHSPLDPTRFDAAGHKSDLFPLDIDVAAYGAISQGAAFGHDTFK